MLKKILSFLLLIRSFLGFTLKQYLRHFILYGIILVIVWYWVDSTNNSNFNANHLNDWYTTLIDPIVSLLTFWAAVFLGIAGYYQSWKNSLEKRLTVHFKLGNKYIMTCHEAYLASEGDIRAWGQQIGSQMTNVSNLDFFPYLTQTASLEYDSDKNQKKHYMRYEVTFHLRNLNEQIEPQKKYENKVKCPNLKDKYLVWWENNNKTLGNQFVWFDEQQENPKNIDEARAEKERRDKKQPPIEIED